MECFIYLMLDPIGLTGINGLHNDSIFCCMALVLKVIKILEQQTET